MFDGGQNNAVWQNNEVWEDINITFLVCDQCGEDIEYGDLGVNLFIGVVGCSPKSGKPVIVPSASADYQEANLHEYCIAKFAKQVICDSQLDDEVYCTACDARLEGD